MVALPMGRVLLFDAFDGNTQMGSLMCAGRFLVIGNLRIMVFAMTVALVNKTAQACNEVDDFPAFATATTVQQPTFGVSISPEGVMQHMQFAPPGGELFRQKAAIAHVNLNADLQRPSPLRKISLAKLQRQIQKLLDQQKPLPEDIVHLAGLQHIEFVIAIPEQHDILLGGPAQGWIHDADGRAVGMHNRRPIILLEDLLTSLRTFQVDRPAGTWVGCSIGPTADNIQRYKEFQRTIPTQVLKHQERAVAQSVWKGVEQSLGQGVITVFGISPRTHMAKVLVEADYRMKLIAIGREPAPIDMPIFFARLKSAPRDNFQRWWFTPNYKCIEMTEDRLALRLAGQGVQLGTEEYAVDSLGNLVPSKSNPLPAAKLFAETFTKRYPEIALVSPVFSHLRTMMDCLIVARFLQREKLLDRCDLDIALLLDPNRIETETAMTPRTATLLANVKWESGTLVAPCGGVSILAEEAFQDSLRLPISERLQNALHNSESLPADRWWSDE